MKKKCLAVGIILLFVGTFIIPTTINATTMNQYGKNLHQKECSLLQKGITVTFTYPENAIYWNDHKIAPFSVPLILHYHFHLWILVKLKIEPLENISKIEFYYNGALLATWFPPGPYPNFDNIELPMTRFSHASLKIIAYTNQGDQGSDEITIWRLFL
jgi:hypothetical protein